VFFYFFFFLDPISNFTSNSNSHARRRVRRRRRPIRRPRRPPARSQAERRCWAARGCSFGIPLGCGFAHRPQEVGVGCMGRFRLLLPPLPKAPHPAAERRVSPRALSTPVPVARPLILWMNCFAHPLPRPLPLHSLRWPHGKTASLGWTVEKARGSCFGAREREEVNVCSVQLNPPTTAQGPNSAPPPKQCIFEEIKSATVTSGGIQRSAHPGVRNSNPGNLSGVRLRGGG